MSAPPLNNNIIQLLLQKEYGNPRKMGKAQIKDCIMDMIKQQGHVVMMSHDFMTHTVVSTHGQIKEEKYPLMHTL